MFHSVRGSLTTLALSILLAGGQPLAEEAVQRGQAWGRYNIAPTECLERGRTALTNVATVFGLNAGPQNGSGFVSLEYDPALVANVYCFGADDRMLNLATDVPPTVTGFVIATTKQVNVTELFNMIRDCIQYGNCMLGPMAGVWTNVEIFGELTLTGGPTRYRGSYTLPCPGGESKGYIIEMMRTDPNSQSYAATFRDGACEGRMVDITPSKDLSQLQLRVFFDKVPGKRPYSTKVILRRKEG